METLAEFRQWILSTFESTPLSQEVKIASIGVVALLIVTWLRHSIFVRDPFPLVGRRFTFDWRKAMAEGNAKVTCLQL
jgi:hypothetical protein